MAKSCVKAGDIGPTLSRLMHSEGRDRRTHVGFVHTALASGPLLIKMKPGSGSVRFAPPRPQNTTCESLFNLPLQWQTTVTAHFSSEQLLLFAIALPSGQSGFLQHWRSRTGYKVPVKAQGLDPDKSQVESVWITRGDQSVRMIDPMIIVFRGTGMFC